MKTLSIASAVACLALVSACKHKVDVNKKTEIVYSSSSSDDVDASANNTCEAQYRVEKQNIKQNYLSAIQQHIATREPKKMEGRVPLDRFRAEINAAYNMVVSRCKTHVRCLEANGYNESLCYISAYDRKDAERAFSTLAIRLREIVRDADKQVAEAKNRGDKKAGKRQTTNVTVTTTVEQDAQQKNHQETAVTGCCKRR